MHHGKPFPRKLASGITKSPLPLPPGEWRFKAAVAASLWTDSLNTAAILASLMEAFLVSQRLSFRSFMSKGHFTAWFQNGLRHLKLSWFLKRERGKYGSHYQRELSNGTSSHKFLNFLYHRLARCMLNLELEVRLKWAPHRNSGDSGRTPSVCRHETSQSWRLKLPGSVQSILFFYKYVLENPPEMNSTFDSQGNLSPSLTGVQRCALLEVHLHEGAKHAKLKKANKSMGELNSDIPYYYIDI